MSETPSPETPRRLLTDLCRLVAERAGVEEEINSGFAARNEAAEKEYQEGQRLLDERYRAGKGEGRRRVRIDAHRGRGEVRVGARCVGEGVRDGPRRKCSPASPPTSRPPEQALQDAHWEAMEAADAARGGLNLPLKEILAGLDTRWHELENIHQQAVALLQRRGHWDEFPEAARHGRDPRKASRAAVLPCPGAGPSPVPQPRQASPAAAVPRGAAAGDILALLGRGGLSVDRRLSAVGTTGGGRPSAAALPPW